jgi:hypothetical protein
MLWQIFPQKLTVLPTTATRMMAWTILPGQCRALNLDQTTRFSAKPRQLVRITPSLGGEMPTRSLIRLAVTQPHIHALCVVLRLLPPTQDTATATAIRPMQAEDIWLPASIPCKALIDAAVDGRRPRRSPASTNETAPANAEPLQLRPGSQLSPGLDRPWGSAARHTRHTLQSSR